MHPLCNRPEQAGPITRDPADLELHSALLPARLRNPAAGVDVCAPVYSIGKFCSLCLCCSDQPGPPRITGEPLPQRQVADSPGQV